MMIFVLQNYSLFKLIESTTKYNFN